MVKRRTKSNFFLDFLLDDVADLNYQEKLLVKDPKNAHLLDVEVEQSGTKRTTEGSSGLTKRKKENNPDPEKDEVSLY